VLSAGRVLVALTLAAGIAAGCSVFELGDPWCPPVDVGGDCFLPSDDAFVAHALESATAWPQLDGVQITAGPVIEGFDEAAGQQTWVVPLLGNGRTVAASRFLPFEGHVRLAEVALYQPPRDVFPVPRAGRHLVLFEMVCPDPSTAACLFQNYGWRVE
jgi:hypothetical protein